MAFSNDGLSLCSPSSGIVVSETAISQLQNRGNIPQFCIISYSLCFRAGFVPFRGEKCDFLKVFVPRVLIFKKLHLLLHSKMEVQGEKCVKNH